MKRSLAILVVLGVMFGLVLVPSTALARAHVTEYTGLETPAAPPADVTCRMSGPNLHCSQTSFWNDVTTDDRMTGFTTVYANFKSPDGVDGHIWGKFVTEVTAYEATWVGSWTGKIIDGVPIFKAVGHGTGELEGLKVMISFEGSPAGIAISGRILEPHGS